jgi:DNA primase catalytic core
MIPQNVIDQIISIPIVDIIQKYTILKKTGANWEGCCPFHDEKTPSFKVFPKTNSYKCFGCGAGGNGIKFVMEKEKLSFPDACRKIGKDGGVQVPDQAQTPEQIAIHNQAESLFIVNSLAAAYFTSQLNDPVNKPALDYALNRWTEETIKQFEIGYAPDKWDGVINFAREKGIKSEILIKAGLIKESEKAGSKLYDYFRGRLIIPIHNKYGRITGFTARAIAADQKPKYLNTPETEIYHKGKTLFGLNLAFAAIKEKGYAYLVEGNADVIRLHQLGIAETVGTSGTALTLDQIQEIKSLCKSITLIGDTDPAGIKAVDRSAGLIIREGLNCNTIRLPTEGEKADPDSFFTSPEQFQEYAKAHTRDHIIEIATSMSKSSMNPELKLKAINTITGLLIHLDTSCHELYIDQLSKIIKPKKVWNDKLKELRKDLMPVVEITERETIPSHVSLAAWEKFGFYEDKNCYFFKTSKGIVRGCNFVLRPLFHIESVQNAKRLFQIINEHGVSRVIELPTRDLVALSRFKECIESLGNFLWEATDTELNKLKRFLYEETKSCIEITQLGWHRDQFYAWGNGIFNGTFTPVDDNGIVRHGETNYYLPAFSKIYAHEYGLFVNERNFLHRNNNDITLREYSSKLIQVFGDNATIALCFYFASLFRDIVIRKFNFYPILNLFGPKGSGKTELAVSMISFFGRQGKGPNINNTTKAALADHVAQQSNACVLIDEYKNSVDFEKIEFLKGLWDGTGRTRMNMDKDKKKETTAVDCAIILSGQEMPTVDIALFSRLIYLTFNKVEYNDAAKVRFNELKKIEDLGNTHITNQLLSLRKDVVKNYSSSYDQVAADLSIAIGEVVIEDRIFRNWLVVLATFHALREKIDVSFTYAELIKLSATQILIQNKETKKSNEISSFWNIISYLAADGLIKETIDYKIECTPTINTDLVSVEFAEATNILYVQMSRVFLLYRKHGKLAGEKILPTDSIDYYLKSDKRYLGKKRTRFRFIDPTLGRDAEYKTKPQYAYCFLYDDLKISLHTENLTDDTSIRRIGHSEENLEDKF